MTAIASSPVNIQTSEQSVPSIPGWFGEVTLIVEHLRKHGVLTKISEGVRFARRRFWHYEMIDFLAVLFGYAISGERTLEAFYQKVLPLLSVWPSLETVRLVPFRSLASDRFASPSGASWPRFMAAPRFLPSSALCCSPPLWFCPLQQVQ